MLAIEMNISSYNFSIRLNLRHAEYFLLLHNIYVFSENISNFSSLAYFSLKNLKHQENSLISLRKNKKFDQFIIFSDNEN